MLVGTQMIVKGHDFPNVTLVGVLAADLSLNDCDYRSGERTFQLLTQAAGRAGRGTKPGEAVIQTYRPEHYSIVRAAGQDYNAFYEEEILYREIGSYPPAAHMLAVLITSPIEETGMELAGKLAELAKKAAAQTETQAEALAFASVIGPAKASIGKINDVYRFMVYCKSGDENVLTKIRDLMEEFTARMESKKEIVQFDFDPMSSY